MKVECTIRVRPSNSGRNRGMSYRWTLLSANDGNRRCLDYPSAVISTSESPVPQCQSSLVSIDVHLPPCSSCSGLQYLKSLFCVGLVLSCYQHTHLFSKKSQSRGMWISFGSELQSVRVETGPIRFLNIFRNRVRNGRKMQLNHSSYFDLLRNEPSKKSSKVGFEVVPTGWTKQLWKMPLISHSAPHIFTSKTR